ncbi:MAG: hypothetical protein B6I20_05250 [Bacteroidetes bacterium 4572_117]|nr:MAG: hypothetical protein B6I20_05250 [Bacteroidetes bacterium 4572_117]
MIYKNKPFRALAFMIIFTPLTLWIALKNPVSDCGCFGDAIVLTNWETFWKNIVLLALAILLVFKAKETDSFFKTNIAYWVLAFGFLSIMFFQWYNYSHLPIIDFRPYSVGTYIPDKMIIPEGAKQDSIITFLYYEKNGETKEFTEDNFPWEDTTWVWKDTKSKVVEKGYLPPIHDFDIYSFNLKRTGGEAAVNITDQMLADTNYSLLLISEDLRTAPFKPFKELTNLMNYCQVHKYKKYFITASVATDILEIHSKLPYLIDFYTADGITLKTIVRSNPGLVLIKQGKILAKWHNNDFPTIKKFKETIGKQ